MNIGYLMQAEEEIRKPPFNGPANHIRQVVSQFIDQGHRVRVLIRLDGKIWATDDLVNYRLVTVRKMDRGPLRWVERIMRRIQSELKLPYLGFFESLRFALACRQELNATEVLLERMSWMSYGGAIAARWMQLPLVLEYNGDPLDDLSAKGLQPRGIQHQISKILMEKNIKVAAHIVATGEGWRNSCMETWKVGGEQITTVENGTRLVNLLAREQLRSFQSEEENIVNLVYLGGFYPWHGVSELLGAFGEVLKAGIQASLFLIGSGVGEPQARQLVAELGIEEKVRFTGQLAAEDYAPILAQADIGLSPYCGWKEYSGLKLLDYKASGLATIASGQDGHPVTLRHGVTGLIVPPCDEAALAEAIQRLCDDPQLRKQMGRQARLEAEKIHSWAHTAQQLERILGEAVRA